MGITKNKAKALQDLAIHFQDGRLSEEFLRQTHAARESDSSCSSSGDDTNAIRQALLNVRGIGEWSCDMFLLFTLEHGDVLPLGDLGVRKGMQKHFFPRSASLCAKKDKAKIHERLDPFRPYRSLVSYYMWRVADTPESVKQEDVSSPSVAEQANVPAEAEESSPKPIRQETNVPTTPPPSKRPKRSSARTVTP